MRFLFLSIFLLFVSALCNCHAGTVISGDAVGDLVIGQPPPKDNLGRLVSRHWLNDENGKKYEMLSIKIHGRQVDAEIHDGRVWRISIERPGLQTRDGVAVGANAAIVLQMNSSIAPEIGPGPSMFLIPANSCGISYMTDFEFGENIPEKLTRATALSMLRASRVISIFVVGCEKLPLRRELRTQRESSSH